jgi:hypothetical protein
MGHHNAFLEVGPLQPLDHWSEILSLLVSAVLIGVPPVMKSIPFNSQSPPRRLWALVSPLVTRLHL